MIDLIDELKKAKKSQARIKITTKSGVTFSCVVGFLTSTHVVMDKPTGKVVFYDAIQAVDFE